jgi:hypothetical protein
MKNAPHPILFTFAILLGGLGVLSSAEDANPAATEKLIFKTEWKGERIELPPSFAPEMGLKGIEEIRFAPGMFDARSDSFFTYVFVFSVPADQKLTEDVIRKEILAYYRGLARAVLKGKGVEVDAGKFTFELEIANAEKEAPESLAKREAATQYSGKLEWVEPFATAKPQTLHFEIQTWSDPKTVRNYLFVCTSPKTRGETDPLWKELRGIRRGFVVLSDSKK